METKQKSWSASLLSDPSNPVRLGGVLVTIVLLIAKIAAIKSESGFLFDFVQEMSWAWLLLPLLIVVLLAHYGRFEKHQELEEANKALKDLRPIIAVQLKLDSRPPKIITRYSLDVKNSGGRANVEGSIKIISKNAFGDVVLADGYVLWFHSTKDKKAEIFKDGHKLIDLVDVYLQNPRVEGDGTKEALINYVSSNGKCAYSTGPFPIYLILEITFVTDPALLDGPLKKRYKFAGADLKEIT